MANIRLPPPPTDAENKDAWQYWYLSIKDSLTSLAGTPHNSLSNLQGGSTTERYHLTSAQLADITALGTASTVSGLSVVITTAKRTVAGAEGSMTFTNGVLTAQTQAT